MSTPLCRSVLLGMLAWLALHAHAVADERILSFDSTITVNRDGTLTVREHIRVRAEGKQIRRGIYRDFPTRYAAEGGRVVTVAFVLESVTRDGQPEPWRIENRDNGVRIYMGSAAVPLPAGEHRYELTYGTDRQMGYFADHDELYWNVTGNGWVFPIDLATATVQLPDDVPAADVRVEAYTGAQGQKGRDHVAEMKQGSPHYRTTRPLREQEGLTIVASWPKGFILPGVERPMPLSGPTSSPGYDPTRDAGQAPDLSALSPAEQVLGRSLPKNLMPMWLSLAGFLLLMSYYWLIWDKVGRDPPARLIIPRYEPPPALSPAAMRYIRRMGYDDECFGAAVLALAVKGCLRIEQDSGVLGFGRSYTLHQTRPTTAAPLSADEQVLLQQLFAQSPALVLKQENHRIVGKARSMHYQRLKGAYTSGFFRINGGWHALGILFSIVVLVLAIAFPGKSEPWPRWYLSEPAGWFTAGLALLGILSNGVFGLLLRARTPEGQAALEHIEGFRLYLEVAEGEELKRVTQPPPPMTAQLYEAYLPAALALDVEQRWAERFAAVLDIQAPNYRPAWYAGPDFDAHRLGAFSAGLSSSLKSAISSSSTPPGSKSGSGGGGSSGGGGGGGGGGGW